MHHRPDAIPALTGFNWLVYLQFLDSALPIGGFSHSFGLETLVQDGRVSTIEDLRSYLHTMLAYSWAPSDLVAIKAVYEYSRANDWLALWHVDRLLHIQRASTESRTGQHKMGRRLLQLANAMYPQLNWEPLVSAVQNNQCFATHPIVHGWVAQGLGVPLEMATHGYAYGCLVQAVGSALRLMSMGQTDGQRLIAEIVPAISPAWKSVETRQPDEISSCTPAAEISMIRHATLYSRLFMS